MKRNLFFLMLFVLATTFLSCSKSNDNAATSPATVADLPLKASQYIDTNYPDASVTVVVKVSNSAAAYIATLNTTEELAFTREGDFLGDGAGYHGHHGGDSIHCDTIEGGHGHHGGHGGHHGHGIPVDSLSQLIRDYVATNFPGYTIRHAEPDSICPEGLVTKVFIGKPGQEPLTLCFDAASAYLMQQMRIRYAEVPQAVRDYITANYPAYGTCHRASQLTLAGNSIQYIIYLRLNRTPLAVRMQADGTLVCIR